jgi:hypothetical protein
MRSNPLTLYADVVDEMFPSSRLRESTREDSKGCVLVFFLHIDSIVRLSRLSCVRLQRQRLAEFHLPNGVIPKPGVLQPGEESRAQHRGTPREIAAVKQSEALLSVT